ncbi:MAG: hypothetical protein MJ229_05900 [bacterium]|nr:hypothetical protein [bacterium]
MQQNGIYELLKQLEMVLDKSFPILPNYISAVKVKDIEEIIDSIFHALPTEIQEARALLKRREEIQVEAQQKAEKIITDAQQEAQRALSESTQMIELQKQANKYKEGIQAECDEFKRKALEDAATIRSQAHDEAIRLKEKVEIYASQVFADLEDHLAKRLKEVKDGQIFLEKQRAASNFNNIYPQDNRNSMTE